MVTVRLADSDIAFPCAHGDTITRAGLRAGVPLPYECNTGACGTCKMELVSGEIDSIRPDGPGLTDRDRAKRRILGCQARPQTDCVIKVRIDAVGAAGPPPQFHPATFASFRDITHHIREFSFELPAPQPFLPGQYALLHLPGVPTGRAYSMSNIAGGSEWQFQVKRVPGGQATSVLFDGLSAGAQVTIDGPYGHAYLRTEAPRDIVCIAGGSGIAPIVSIARGIAQTVSLAERRLYVFYGGRRPEDICGEDMLRALPALAGRCTYVPVISCPDDDASPSWTGRRGFVHEAVSGTLESPLSGFEFYFAGPPPMTLAVQRMLMEAKVPMNQMHFDQFF
jgi:toluene monooxygenase electron transfer component